MNQQFPEKALVTTRHERAGWRAGGNFRYPGVMAQILSR
ncbi:hypothetical protein ABH944_007293 [Caballeronia udeis]|uniref:Uncharacterized protein n=1 Tax=Caballeronia udeis TaxID=1232866 RepID=A0ABW8MTE3_9BURK